MTKISMCGINGFNFKDQDLIAKMVKSTRHRGPDDEGIFVDSNISLGHNRLSIIDLSPGGHQPMISASGKNVIVYNGEIYNFPEIKKELEGRGRKFRSTSDTEVLLEAYEEYGADCLKKLNGIFAFAIWNKEKEELFLARDHIGVKPLFYFYDGNKLIFSSEIKGILKHDIKREIDNTSLNLYFRFLFIKGPNTIWKNIYKLLPGHYLILKQGRLQKNKYWELNDPILINDYDEAKTEIRNELKAAVKRQLISDVPVGLFLSGGLDSTILLGLMSEVMSEPVKTFSVGFDIKIEEEKFNSDYRLAEATAALYGTDHRSVILTEADVRDNLENVVQGMDDLVSNPIQIANYILAKLTAEKVKVVLGGDGGDELFGGYQRYYYAFLIDKLNRIPLKLRKNILMHTLAGLTRQEKRYEKFIISNTEEVYWSFMAQKEKSLAGFLTPEINDATICRDYLKKELFSGIAGNLNLAEGFMRADTGSWLTDESLARSDKMSMAHGLEQRVPILDIEMVRLAARIPVNYKIGSKFQGKKIFKEALKEYIPDNIYNKEKSGWFSPTAKWLRAGLKDMAYEILSESYNPEAKAMFDFKNIRKILDDHVEHRQYALDTIWSLINFQVWYKNFK